MYKTFKGVLFITWLLDVMNFDFMQTFDTVYPFNGLFWFVIWLVILN